jgi:hypothetical protein
VQTAAAKILIVGGVLNIALSFVVGFVWGRKRMRDPMGEVPPYLELSHRMALWEGFMLLGLVFAVLLSDLRAAVETVAAYLLVASSVFQDASVLLNWRQGVRDQFAERSFGQTLATINSVLAAVGLAILIVGIFKGL